MSISHGGLFVTGGSVAQALDATNKVKLTGFTAEAVASEDQGELSIVPVIASDKITLKHGRYLVLFTVSGTHATPPSGTDAVDYPDLIVELFKAGVTYGNSLRGRSAGNPDSAHTHLSFQGFVDVTAADDPDNNGVDFDVRGTLAWLDNEAAGESSESSSINHNFTPDEMSLSALKVW